MYMAKIKIKRLKRLNDHFYQRRARRYNKHVGDKIALLHSMDEKEQYRMSVVNSSSGS